MSGQATVRTEKPILAPNAIIGIVAVSLAAVNSSLGSGLISAGLEDLRGAWHLGIDDAAYIPTAFGAAQMFMGPVSVMLAARFGHRPVLMIAGLIYILTSLILPMMPPVAPILVLLVIGGLASGTFYPLCLSLITRNLPLALVSYGVAAYNLDLLGTLHVVQSLESFYIDHAGWQWLFWNQCFFSMPFILCVYFGIPPTPKAHLIPQFSYSGILYISGGLTLLYIALNQGERLDWFNNGLINGLFIGSAILFAASIVRRYRAPNPFLDFSYLRQRNIILMAVMLIAFRAMLLRIGFIIPLFLERVHQYRSTELGWLFLLSVGPFLIAMPLVAYFMTKFETRIILFVGFFLLALINYNDAHTLSTWIGRDFVFGQLIGAIGICSAAMGTMCGIVFEGRVTGAYRNRAGAYCQGAFFQAIRLFGSESSTSTMRRFILVREHFWQTHLAAGAAIYSQLDNRVSQLTQPLVTQAASVNNAAAVAFGLTAKRLDNEALTLAIDDSFMLLAVICMVGMVGVALMKKVPLPKDLPAIDA